MAQKQTSLYENMNTDNQCVMQHHTDNGHIEDNTNYDSFSGLKSSDLYPDSKGKGFETYLMTGDMIIRTSVPQVCDQSAKPALQKKQKVSSQPDSEITHHDNKVKHSKIPQSTTRKNNTEKKTQVSKIPKVTTHNKESKDSKNEDTVSPQVVPNTPNAVDSDWYSYSNTSGPCYPELDIPPDDISSEDDAYKTLDTCLNLDDLPPPPADLLIQKPLDSNRGYSSDQVVPEFESFVSSYGQDFTKPADMSQNQNNTRVQEGLCSYLVNENLVSEPNKCDTNEMDLPAETSRKCHQNNHPDNEHTNPNMKGMVRTSKSHENYLESNKKEAALSCIDIDFDENKASSVDVLTYGSISMETTQCSNCTAENESMLPSDSTFKSHIWPENTQSDSALPHHTSPTHKPLQTSDGIVLDLDSLSDVNPYTARNGENHLYGEQGLIEDKKQTVWLPEDNQQSSDDLGSSVSPSRTPVQVTQGYGRSSKEDCTGNEIDFNEDLSKNSYLEDSQYSDTDSICHQVYKDVDQPSAARLAKRLFLLDGFKKQDVSRHLGKK